MTLSDTVNDTVNDKTMTLSDNVTDNDADTWVSVSEAAELLDKSERTVWRWVKRGKLAIDRSVTPHLVNVSDVGIDTVGDVADTVVDTVTDKAVTPTGTPDRVSGLESEIQELREERDRLETEAQELRTARDELASRLDRLASENEQLEAANDRLRDVLDEVRSERDYLRQAHAASLSNQQRLLETQTGRRSWLERLLPWTREEED